MNLENIQVLLNRLIGAVETAECLSPTECHNAAYGLLGHADAEAIRSHARECAACQARLAQAEHEAQEVIECALAALDEPAKPAALPANLMELISPGPEWPTKLRVNDVWEAWQARVKRWIRPVPAPAVALTIAARGVPADSDQVPFGRGTVEVECAVVRAQVQTVLASGAMGDIWVQLIDRSGRPVSGRVLQLLSEGAATPETQRTSPRGRAVFRARQAGQHILRVDEGEFVGIEIGDSTCAV